VNIQFVDTNIFIRYLTNEYPEKIQACYELFKRMEQNRVALFTSESVVAEVIYVLTSKKLYNLSPEYVKDRLYPLLSLPGFKLPQRSIYLRALDLYVALQFDFSDCLSAAHMERQRLHEIYSYDQDFDRIGNVNWVEPRG
jgi:uncharacterized protein